MAKERRCLNPKCRKLLIDEPDLLCSRCKRQGWRITKKAGKVVGVFLLVAGSAAAGIKGGSNNKKN